MDLIKGLRKMDELYFGSIKPSALVVLGLILTGHVPLGFVRRYWRDCFEVTCKK